MNSAQELESIRRQREERITQLESRLSKPRPLGVRPPLAIAAIAGALMLLWMQRLEVAYLFAPRAPLIIGAEGSYDFAALRSNRYAQVHGTPSLRGTYFTDSKGQGLIVGLKDTPLLVKRGLLPGEEWREGGKPPRPDQRPFTIGGRLLSQDDAARFDKAFPLHAQWGEVRPRDGKLWILVEGERPGEDLGAYLGTGLLALVILANAYLIAGRYVPALARPTTR